MLSKRISKHRERTVSAMLAEGRQVLHGYTKLLNLHLQQNAGASLDVFGRHQHCKQRSPCAGSTQRLHLMRAPGCKVYASACAEVAMMASVDAKQRSGNSLCNWPNCCESLTCRSSLHVSRAIKVTHASTKLTINVKTPCLKSSKSRVVSVNMSTGLRSDLRHGQLHAGTQFLQTQLHRPF